MLKGDMDEDMRVIDGVDRKYFYGKNMDGCCRTKVEKVVFL